MCNSNKWGKTLALAVIGSLALIAGLIGLGIGAGYLLWG